MSEFKDFLDQLKVRLTNPLIFSFLISWMVIHWQIIVGAFYLSQNELKALGYSNFLEFVAANINWYNGFWQPLSYALLYTVISPMLRIGVQYFNTWINKLGNERIRNVAKEGYIQYELYDNLLEEVKSQRNRFEEIIQQNNELNNETTRLADQIFTLQKERTNFLKKNSSFRKN